MMPLRSFLPSTGGNLPGTGGEFDIELPGIAVDVAAGEKLFLTVSPISDNSFGHGSRTPGFMAMEDMRVHVPTVAQ